MAACSRGQPVAASSVSRAHIRATPDALSTTCHSTSWRALPSSLPASTQADSPDPSPEPSTSRLPLPNASSPADAMAMATTVTVDEDCATTATTRPSAKAPAPWADAPITSRSQGSVFRGTAPVLMKSMPRNSRQMPSSAPTRWR